MEIAAKRPIVFTACNLDASTDLLPDMKYGPSNTSRGLELHKHIAQKYGGVVKLHLSFKAP